MRLWKTAVCTGLALACLAGAANGQVRISQVYPGAGCTTTGCSLFTNDYVELYNAGTAAVDLSTYSLQYQAATTTGAFGNRHNLSGTIQPHSYFLVQETGNANGTNPLPTADLVVTTGALSLAAGGGKVALASIQTAISGCTDAAILDLVGYGTANCSEGSAAPAPGSNSNAIFRASNGCIDSGNNASDFSAATAAPRNSASPTFTCPVSTPPSGVGGTTPASQCPGFPILLTCTVSQGANPASPISSVIADTTNIGGGPGLALLDNGTGGDVMAGDGIYSATATIGGAITPGNKNVPVAITDGVPRTGNASITVVVSNCALRATTGTGANPAAICNGTSTVLTVVVAPGTMPSSTGIQVRADLSGFFGPFDQLFTDNGNNVWTYTLNVAANQTPNTNVIPFTISDNETRMYNGTLTLTNLNCTQSTAPVVISQVYGGGGNTGAPLQNDFIELYNRTGAAIDITGWSVQYASATGTGGFTAANTTTLTGSIPAHGYFLVIEAAGSSCTGSTPCGSPITLSADTTGTIGLGSSAGKVALVMDSTALGTACTGATIVDFVGYGNANCFEGLGGAPTLSNTEASFRNNGGCSDNDHNIVDFTNGVPNPRNSTITHSCTGIPTGACCAANGSCSVTTMADCSASYQGDNSVCAPNPCPQPTGACCHVADGSCTVTTAAGCSGNAFQGAGTSCSPNPCPQPNGACCCGAGCTITSAAACSGTNQRFAGGGTVCNAAGNFTTPCCKGDYNKAAAGNVVSVQDIFDFLGGYFSNSNCADTNASGTISVQDIFDFLSAYFGGC